MILKHDFFIKTNGYQKMCDTNQNVTKMAYYKEGLLYFAFKKFSLTTSFRNFYQIF